nr:MAG TPA: hypothetical protein [Caudoviricetes sp.]
MLSFDTSSEIHLRSALCYLHLIIRLLPFLPTVQHLTLSV